MSQNLSNVQNSVKSFYNCNGIEGDSNEYTQCFI